MAGEGAQAFSPARLGELEFGDQFRELMEKNKKLEADLDKIKEQIGDKEKKEREARHESTMLRSELDHVYQKLEHARKVKEMCTKDPKKVTWGQNKSRSADAAEMEDADNAVARMRSISDAVMMEAERDLDTAMKQMRNQAAMASARTWWTYFLLLLVTVLLLPGVLLLIRDAGIIDIKKGNILSDVVNEWEAQTRNGVYAIRHAMKGTFSDTCTKDAEVQYIFDARKPPRMAKGFDNINATELTVIGEASLRVCANGTSEQSFLRRDDCDGCLCSAGSVWLYYKDKRFWGSADHCVQEKQWKDCINKWTFGLHRPNFCWEFIWNGGRQDPTCQSPKVMVDSCSLHHGCYIMVKRWRQWVLLKDFFADRDLELDVEKNVGILEEEISTSNRTINIDLTKRSWGFPASTQSLLKIGSTASNVEWQPLQKKSDRRPFLGGKQHKIWQLRSLYVVTGVDMQGVEYMMTNWTQHEYNLYVDSMKA